MGQGGQLFAHLMDALQVDVGKNNFAIGCSLIGGPRQHQAPGIDNHAVSEGFASPGVAADLRRGKDIGLVFHGAGPQQQFPVRLSGGYGEG